MRYLPDFRSPDKALDLVDQACAAVRFQTLTPQRKMKSGGGTPPAQPAARRSSHVEMRVGREEIAAAEWWNQSTRSSRTLGEAALAPSSRLAHRRFRHRSRCGPNCTGDEILRARAGLDRRMGHSAIA